MFKKLTEEGEIHCEMIIDSAMGYALEQASFVLSGAEAVSENGGIINRVIQINIDSFIIIYICFSSYFCLKKTESFTFKF